MRVKMGTRPPAVSEEWPGTEMPAPNSLFSGGQSHVIRYSGSRKKRVRSFGMREDLHDRDGNRTADGGRARPDRRLVARRQLPVGRADLPAGQPAAAGAAAARAREAAVARALGHHAWAQPDLRAPQPGDQELGP